MKKFGDRSYLDMWGPARHPTIYKKTYHVSFIDDNSGTIFDGAKSETFEKYQLYKAMMHHQRGVHDKALISDRGGKYTGSEFEQHLTQQGTQHHLTVHSIPEQNGVAKCLNRTLVERNLCHAAGIKITQDFMGICNPACQLHEK
jgi:hypothetical protein